MRYNELFDRWAADYDRTVFATEHEYVEVFANYEGILHEIAANVLDKKDGVTLEIGVGTGNLSRVLAELGFYVIGVEPSPEMRKVASQKLKRAAILDGHFLSIPLQSRVDSIVSSYALHHLTRAEKADAMRYLDGFLKPGGKIVIADTMFGSAAYKEQLLRRVVDQQAHSLLLDLQSEFYEYVDDILSIFHSLDYDCSAKQMNRYVWVVIAQKKGSSRDD